MFQLEIPGVVWASTYAGAGKREESGVINHPRQQEEGDVEREFDLAKVDGSAGVRKGRENMEA